MMYVVLKKLSFNKKTFWKLLNSFNSKNLPLTNFNTFKETKIGKIDKFTLNIEAFNLNDYILRLYSNYNSTEFIKNSNSLIKRFVSNYKFNKRKIGFLPFYQSRFLAVNSDYGRINNDSEILYPHYFSISNFFNHYRNVCNDSFSSLVFNFESKSLLEKSDNNYFSIDLSNLRSPHVYSGILSTVFIVRNVKNFIPNKSSIFPEYRFHTMNKKQPLYVNYYIRGIISKKKLPIFLNFTFEHSHQTPQCLFNIKHPNSVHIDTAHETSYNLIPKSNSSFVIQHLGLFLHFKLFWFKQKFNHFKFKFKKKIYSFYKTNEIKKTLMEGRKSLFIFKYISSTNFDVNRLNNANYSGYNLNLDFYLKKRLELRSLSSLKFKQTHYMSHLLGYNRSTSEIGYEDHTKDFTLNPKQQQTELRITRLRFNPGYQRLWREYRLALADAIRFRYIYQRQLTRYLVKFYSCLKSYNILALEYKIWKVIIYSQLLPDIHSIKNFMANSLIFLNGLSLHSEDNIMVVSDIVQIQVSVWYYIYYKWLMSWNNLRIRKFKKLVYRKKIAGSYTIIKSLKQKSKYTPLYIYNMRFDMSDTKSYLEIDYFTLSFVFLYDNFVFDVNSSDDFPEMRHYVYRMYNWKYIN